MRRLKAFLMSFVLITYMLGASGTASASSYSTGKAVIPSFGSNKTMCSFFYVSNITDKPINVTITLYNLDGSIIIDDNSPTTGRIALINGTPSNYNEAQTDCSLTLTIDANCTNVIGLPYDNNNNLLLGYGVIQWTQSGRALQGLIVSGQKLYITTTGDNSRLNIDVNNGLPF